MRKSGLIPALIIFQTTVSFSQDNEVITQKVFYKTVGNTELSVDIFYTETSQQK